MELDRAQKVKVGASIAALTASALFLFTTFGPEGCGASEEETRILAAINNLPEITEKDGRVKRIEVTEGEGGGDNVYRYEAEILNAKGVAIGRLRGGRVEGFATMKPRFLWYKTPGVPEEWPARPPRGERRRGGPDGRMRPPRDGEGRPGPPGEVRPGPPPEGTEPPGPPPAAAPSPQP